MWCVEFDRCVMYVDGHKSVSVVRCFFFFSSRRRHTRYIGDWSSDVCSSDLLENLLQVNLKKVLKIRHVAAIALGFTVADGILLVLSQLLPMLGPSVIIVTIIAGLAYSLILFTGRSEERRVGKECRLLWLPES